MLYYLYTLTVFQTAYHYPVGFKALLKTYNEISTALPDLRRLPKNDESRSDSSLALARIYHDVIQCHRRTYTILIRKS